MEIFKKNIAQHNSELNIDSWQSIIILLDIRLL